ncbi:MAG TPA: YgaP-like transmembrane domain [Candidatus Saccharimonadales bacterium]|jgi:hypothetical protein|nr:YgaP-like transmembrane domain [Candidatus Saccharimonadales bacterium]
MNFSKFMASGAGRLLRVVVGVVLICMGFFVMKNEVGYVVGAIGVVPLLAGIFDFCIFALLFDMPFMGKAIRAINNK